MVKNLGTTDKAIRIVLAVLIVVLYFSGNISGVVGGILLAVAAILLLTSFVSFCPIYSILGLSSKNK